MEDTTALLLEIRSLLTSARDRVDALADAQLTNDEREILAGAVRIIRAYDAQSRADALRWIRSHRAGHDGWLIQRSAEDGSIQARYYATLGPAVRRALG